MNKLEQYNKIFIENLDVTGEQLKSLAYQSVPSWDSVRHMAIMASLEEAFDIMMETDDIIDFSSYEKGIEILKTKYDVEL
jgi:acyl carrier protein